MSHEAKDTIGVTHAVFVYVKGLRAEAVRDETNIYFTKLNIQYPQHVFILSIYIKM